VLRTGGKKAAQAAEGGGTAVAAGHANTKHFTVAMITHAAAGDTFWDIIRHGAIAAAAKDNITLKYSNNDDPTQQAQLIDDAINSKVDGIAVTDPNPGALCPSIKKAKAAGIPVVMFNAGYSNYVECGGMEYFGQDEQIAASRRASGSPPRARRTCCACCRPRARPSSRPGARA
jgi:simple sugar transport system substrate-binding protein